MPITKRVFSASTNGRGVTVTGTTATGTLIHTSVTGANDWDEVYLYAVNTTTVNRKLTVEWARSTGQAGQPIEFTVPLEDGLYLVVPGLPLGGGRQVRAYTASASSITVHGFVNRITQA
jgi:hypothetical protein